MSPSASQRLNGPRGCDWGLRGGFSCRRFDELEDLETTCPLNRIKTRQQTMVGNELRE
jgi:hypothetical protein